jgi:hypothetical protein
MFGTFCLKLFVKIFTKEIITHVQGKYVHELNLLEYYDKFNTSFGIEILKL